MREFERMNQSLVENHDSQIVSKNPVLVGLRKKEYSVDTAKWIVGQYSYLPQRIVSVLTAVRDRLYDHQEIYETLGENIAQECGSATGGYSHFTILSRVIDDTYKLAIKDRHVEPVTSEFVGTLLNAIHEKSPAFASGVAYGLEASASPELTIVANILNEVANLAGSDDVITPHLLVVTDENRAIAERILAEKEASMFTLEDFFVVHLQEFEVGHRDDLARDIKACFKREQDIKDIESGFEFLLDQMDSWWTSLAQGSQAVAGS